MAPADPEHPGPATTTRDRVARRIRRALRREAHDLLHGGPPTLPLMRPIGPEVPSDAHVQQVLDLCLRVGEVLLSSGEGAAETTAVMLRLASALGLSTVDVDITFTAITICCHRGMVAVPITSLRLVQYRAVDLSRLAAVTRIGERVERGRLALTDAGAALAEAVDAPHPYPRWVATAGWAGLAASIALLLGGAPLTALVAFAVTAVIDRVGRRLARWELPAFFQQVVGGLLATGSTLALFGLGALPPGTRPALVVAAGITVLLSGLSVVGTVQDAISGYLVTSAGRAMEVLLLSAGLLTGVVLGLRLGAGVDLRLEVAGELPRGAARFGISLLAAATAAGAFALAGYAPLRSLPAAGLAGAAGWGSYHALTEVLALGPVASTGAAATVVGLASGWFRRRGGALALVIALAGIIPLLPGLTAYRGFYSLAVQGVADGLVTVTLALATGLALAAGVALGQFVARPRTVRSTRSEPPPAPQPQ